MSLEAKLCPACQRYFEPKFEGQVVCTKADCVLEKIDVRIPATHLRHLSRLFHNISEGVRIAVNELLQRYNLGTQFVIETTEEMQKLNVYVPKGLAALVRDDANYPNTSAAIRHALYRHYGVTREGDL